MKQIYDFEGHRPPVLNEKMLRRRQERKKERLQVILAVAAGVLMLLALSLLGLFSVESFPLVTLLCVGYVVVSLLGGGAIVMVYTRKGGAAI